MQITFTFAVPIQESKVSEVIEGIRNVGVQLFEQSRTEKTVVFTAEEKDPNIPGRVLLSWIGSEDSPIIGYNMLTDQS